MFLLNAQSDIFLEVTRKKDFMTKVDTTFSSSETVVGQQRLSQNWKHRPNTARPSCRSSACFCVALAAERGASVATSRRPEAVQKQNQRFSNVSLVFFLFYQFS